EIERLLNKLQGYGLYQLFSPKQKDKYVKFGKWCFLVKKELLEKADFSKALSDNCYKGGISLTQVHTTCSV
ncbi:hypothetical protein LCGC14_2108910, partial [marine sediment metagenome]